MLGFGLFDIFTFQAAFLARVLRCKRKKAWRGLLLERKTDALTKSKANILAIYRGVFTVASFRISYCACAVFNRHPAKNDGGLF